MQRDVILYVPLTWHPGRFHDSEASKLLTDKKNIKDLKNIVFILGLAAFTEIFVHIHPLYSYSSRIFTGHVNLWHLPLYLYCFNYTLITFEFSGTQRRSSPYRTVNSWEAEYFLLLSLYKITIYYYCLLSLWY